MTDEAQAVLEEAEGIVEYADAPNSVMRALTNLKIAAGGCITLLPKIAETIREVDYEDKEDIVELASAVVHIQQATFFLVQGHNIAVKCFKERESE